MKKSFSFAQFARIMFPILLLTVCAKTFTDDDCCDTGSGSCCPTCSRTFLRHRPVSQDMSIQYGLQKYFVHQQKDVFAMPESKNGKQMEQPDDRFFSWQTNVFYHQSKNKKDLRRYFLKECKDCLVVAQPEDDTTPTDVPNDINSLWLQLGGDLSVDPSLLFSSNITICPERKVLGFAWNFHFDFNRWLKNTWMDLFVPLVHVRHHINVQESNVTGRGTFDGDLSNATEAFNNKDWCYGKISPCVQTKTGIDDLKLTFGWHFWNRETSSIAWYGNLFIPTQGGSNAKYLFEPTVGTGGHFGLGTGFNFDWNLCDKDEWMINWINDIRFAYFFQHDERRSLDLCNNGEWSRYLLVAKSDNLPASLPGINYFTRKVEIKPRFNLEFLSLMHFEYQNWNFEVGYNLWYRQQEDIKLCGGITECVASSNGCQTSCETDCNTSVEVGIYDIARSMFLTPGQQTTASTATIEQAASATSDSTATFVQNSDFNLNSGRVPTSITSKVFFAVGYDYEMMDRPMFMGLGFSYEIAHKKSAYQQWGIWFKKSVSF